jgi:hypothetical protein
MAAAPPTVRHYGYALSQLQVASSSAVHTGSPFADSDGAFWIGGRELFSPKAQPSRVAATEKSRDLWGIVMTALSENISSLWLPKLAALEWRPDGASSPSEDQLVFDLRLFAVADRRALERRGDALHRLLPSMQLWSLRGAPVRIPRKGQPLVFKDGDWQPLPLADVLAEGRPCSFQTFAENRPGLVGVDALQDRAEEEAPNPRALAERALAAAVELLEGAVAQGRFAEDAGLALLQQLAEVCQTTLAEVGAERQGLEQDGFDPPKDWEQKTANARLRVPIALLHVQLQLASAGVEIPARLLCGNEILTLGLAADTALLMQEGQQMTKVLEGAKRAEFNGRWAYILGELTNAAAAEHLERCGRDELAAIHTFARFREAFWHRAEEALALFRRSCGREAQKARLIAVLKRIASCVSRSSAAVARRAADLPGRAVQALAGLVRALPV